MRKSAIKDRFVCDRIKRRLIIYGRRDYSILFSRIRPRIFYGVSPMAFDRGGVVRNTTNRRHITERKSYIQMGGAHGLAGKANVARVRIGLTTKRTNSPICTDRFSETNGTAIDNGHLNYERKIRRKPFATRVGCLSPTPINCSFDLFFVPSRSKVVIIF